LPGCTCIRILKIADFTVARDAPASNLKKIADFTFARMHLHQNLKNHRFHCCQDASASEF